MNPISLKANSFYSNLLCSLTQMSDSKCFGNDQHETGSNMPHFFPLFLVVFTLYTKHFQLWNFSFTEIHAMYGNVDARGYIP